MSTLIRTAALQVPALTSILFGSMLAEDERPAGAWHAEWQPLRDAILLVGGAADTAAELTAGLEPNPDRMRNNLDLTNGQIVSERVSAVLSPAIGKIQAKKLLQSAAFTSHKTGQPLATLLKNDPLVTQYLADAEIIRFSSRSIRSLAVSLEGSGPRPNGSVLDWHDTPSAFWDPSPTGGGTI
jgi:adenylosuccinate lyase